MAMELGNNFSLVEDETNGWTILSSVNGREMKLVESVIHEKAEKNLESEERHERNESTESDSVSLNQILKPEVLSLKEFHVLESENDKITDSTGQSVENCDNTNVEILDENKHGDVDVDAKEKLQNLIKDSRFEVFGNLSDCVKDSLEDHSGDDDDDYVDFCTELMRKHCVEKTVETCVDDDEDEDDLRYMGWDLYNDGDDEEESQISDADDDYTGLKDDVGNDALKGYGADPAVFNLRKTDVPWMCRQNVEPNRKHGVKQGFVEENPCPKQGIIWRVSLVATVGLFGWAVMTGLTGGGKNVRCTKMNPCNMKGGEPVLNSM